MLVHTAPETVMRVHGILAAIIAVVASACTAMMLIVQGYQLKLAGCKAEVPRRIAGSLVSS